MHFCLEAFYVVDAYHLEINFCISIVCIHQAGGGGPWCWQLRAVQFVFEEVLYAFTMSISSSLCGEVVQSDSSFFSFYF